MLVKERLIKRVPDTQVGVAVIAEGYASQKNNKTYKYYIKD